MLERLRLIFSKLTVPVWIVMLAVALSKKNELEYAVQQGQKLWRFLDAHPLWVFIGGFGFIGLVVSWPGLKPKLPSWMKVKTTQERMRDLERDKIPLLLSTQTRLAERLDGMEPNVKGVMENLSTFMKTMNDWLNTQNDSLTSLHKDRLESIQQRGALRIDVGKLERAMLTVEDEIRTASSRLDEQRSWIGEVQRTTGELLNRVHSLERSAQRDRQEISSVPLVVIRLIEHGALIQEATLILETLVDFRQMYPSSAVTQKPFSRTWRPNTGTDVSDDIRDGIWWGRRFQEHVSHVEQWGSQRGLNLAEPLLDELKKLPDASGDLAEQVLSHHVNRLRQMRDDYAFGIRDKALL